MKRILTLLLLFTISALSFAQNNTTKKVNIDERLYDVYDKIYLTQLQADHSFLLQRWAFYLDHSYYVTTYPSQKGNPNYPIIEVADLNHLNILLLEKEQKMTHDFEKQTVYKIKNTDKVLVYYSGKKFNKMLNEHLGKKY